MLVITSIYASILALIVIFLAIRVINYRRSKSVVIGDNGDKDVLQAIRVHANATEYIPLMIILMGIFEANGGSTILLHVIGTFMVIGRVLHAIGLSKSVGVSFGRVAGIGLTMLTILILVGLNIYYFITGLI
jgi:uncharacterized membrane protein YecN with MAPEG domain